MARPSRTPYEINLMKQISSNLQALVKKRDTSQAKLSEKTGIAKTTLSGYFNGTSLPVVGNVQKLADALNVKKSEIDPRFKTEPENAIPVTPRTIKIPVIGKIACGNPIDAEENIEDYLYLPADMVPPGENFALIAEGDSMEPEITSGSKVVVRKQEEVENGEIAAVLVNGDTEATLKRVRYQNGHVILTPDNGKYDPMIITENNPARIVGKAVMITKFL